MSAKFETVAELFRSADPQMRVEMLLDFAKKLPPLPERYREQRDAGQNQVHECMTPVFAFVEIDDDRKTHLFIEVAEEAPTIQGFAGILKKCLDGAPPEEVASFPADLIAPLGLSDVIRMNRVVGLSALVARVKHLTAQAAAA